jgi:hypothetical protein
MTNPDIAQQAIRFWQRRLGGIGSGFAGFPLCLADDLLGDGHESLLTVDLFFVHVLHDRPESLVGFGVRKLKLALLVERHHRNPLVRGGEDCRGVLLYSRGCEAGRAASAKGAGAGQVMAAGAPATQSKGAVGAVPVSENKTTELAISKSASTDATSALGIITFILVARGAFDASCDRASFSARASTCSASCTKPTLRNLVAASRSRVTVVNISASMPDPPSPCRQATCSDDREERSSTGSGKVPQRGVTSA